LLLAATVLSFAHMPLGISDRNNGNTAHEAFTCTHPPRASTRLDRPQASLSFGTTRPGIEPCGVFSTTVLFSQRTRFSHASCYFVLTTMTRAATNEKFRGVEVAFGNDYNVINVQSTMMRPFCSDQLTN